MSYAGSFEATRTSEESLSRLQQYFFPAFLAFSVCFYSLRFIFGWGAETTIFESDMPARLAVLKDVVWIALLLLTAFSSTIGRAVEQASRHKVVFSLLFLFCGWMLLCSVVHVLWYNEPLIDTGLYNIRKPLEYIPAALLAATFIGSWRYLGAVWKGLNTIAICFAVYELVAFLGGWKQTGFGWASINTRFGGILGSPNDWGVYAGCAVVAIAILRKPLWQLWGFLAALVLSQSRSAVAGFLIALVSVSYRSDIRRIFLYSICALIFVGFALSFIFSLQPADFLPTHVAFEDASTQGRLDELATFKRDFRELDLGALTFGVRYFHVESFYLALIIRAGLPALLLYLVIIGMTLVRGWRLRLHSYPHAIALAVTVLISAASLFVPYPDVYPTNFYLWLAIGVIWMEPSNEGRISQLAIECGWAT